MFQFKLILLTKKQKNTKKKIKGFSHPDRIEYVIYR